MSKNWQTKTGCSQTNRKKKTFGAPLYKDSIIFALCVSLVILIILKFQKVVMKLNAVHKFMLEVFITCKCKQTDSINLKNCRIWCGKLFFNRK